MDNLEFLDSPEGEAKVVPAENAEPVQEAVQVEAPLSEPPTPTEPPVPTEAAKPEPVMVPLAALHETRDEVKALKAELETLRQPAQPQMEAPDRYEDPEGFEAFNQAIQQNAILNVKLDISEEMARAAHGDEVVTAAQEWAKRQFQANPAYQAEVLSKRNPYGFVVEQFQRQQALEKLGGTSEIDAFLAWKQAQQAIQQAAPAATPETPTPTRSIAAAPSAGGVQHVAVGPGVAFDDAIK